jgi:hypothetical protein
MALEITIGINLPRDCLFVIVVEWRRVEIQDVQDF